MNSNSRTNYHYSWIQKAKCLVASCAIVFVLSCIFPQLAHAETATIDGVRYTYVSAGSVQSNSIGITGIYSSSKSKAVIPEKINGRPIEAVDLGEKPNLGSITSLDFGKRVTGIRDFYCEDSTLVSIDFSGCPVMFLTCNNNKKLTSLKIKGNEGLWEAECWGNALTSLDFSGCEYLTTLECSNENLRSLNVNGCANLEVLYCTDGELTSLDISTNKKLDDLLCYYNRIKDVSCLGKWANSTNRPQKIAGQGHWHNLSKGWVYCYGKGERYEKGWLKLGSTTYYFDSQGWMKTGWQKISSKWYYFKSSGAMATGWQKIKGKWYYLGSDGVMQTGKKTISGKTYYLTSSGAMKTGWNKESGKWHYYKSSGAMAKGWAKVKNKWYYLNPSDGVMKTGLYDVSGKRYFSNSSGVMQTGWKQLNNKWYYFNKSGAMQKNKWISGKYWVGSDGVMATSTWVDNDRYFVGANGKWMKNKTR